MYGVSNSTSIWYVWGWRDACVLLLSAEYFKTQLMALGVQADHIDYMVGHTVDTYHDIQMKGVEFLSASM